MAAARVTLLDVNVLIAALDAGHVHHSRVRDWLGAVGAGGWASSPLTQNGCVRIMSQPSYPSPLRPTDVVERLREATAHPAHEFWADDVSVLDDTLVDTTRIHGPRQLTDVYLLALAVSHDGVLVTFDRSIAVDAVRGATVASLVVL